MAKRKRLKLKADELRALRERSKNKCECCGLDITVDKHHVWEFAKGGSDIASNILCLCPSCHRVLPKLLSEEDQKFIQSLNFEKRSDSFSFYSTGSEFQVGSILSDDVKYILVLDGKPVIYPYQVGERFYLNIIMLGSFDPYLLVIANRVIYKSENITLVNKPEGLKIMNGNDLILEIEKSNNRIKTKLNFKHRGETFIFNDQFSRFPGDGYMINVSIKNTSGAAIEWNMR